MPLSLKTGIALTSSILGLGSSIAIPLSMSSDVKPGDDISIQQISELVTNINQMEGLKDNDPRVSKCQLETIDNLQSVDFGSSSFTNICGKMEESNRGNLTSEEMFEPYTSLFQEKWDKRLQNGKVDKEKNGGGMIECGETGMILNEDNNGKEVLGLCGANNLDSTLFVQKMINSENKTTIKVCSGECFIDQDKETRNPKILKTKTMNENGKNVQFFTKRS